MVADFPSFVGRRRAIYHPRFELVGSRRFEGWHALILAGLVSALAAVAFGAAPPLMVVGGLAGIVVLVLTVQRPWLGCAILVATVPLTAGLGRNTLVPYLRVSEALTVVVASGALVSALLESRRRRFSGLDLAVGGYTLGSLVVPVVVLLTGVQVVTGWGAFLVEHPSLLGPAQYLVLYLLFSRVELSQGGLRIILNLAMAASVVVALVAIAQLADLPGVRQFIAVRYPPPAGTAPCVLSVCRPSSLLEHYSGLGAYAALNYTIGLALALTRGSGFSARWLILVMSLNALTVVISATQAAVIGILLATVLVSIHRRRLPRQLAPVLMVIGAGVVLFWSTVQSRVEEQLLSGTGSGQVATPESLQTRDRYWSEFFVPILKEHIWLGTGTLIPNEVPARFARYVDNEYLGMGFRAGAVGEVLLFAMLISVAIQGWRSRGHPDPQVQAVAAIASASIVVLAVMGVTAEYLTYAGVAQTLWLAVGRLGATRLEAGRIPDGLVVMSATPSRQA